MGRNKTLIKNQKAPTDEYYTQYSDVKKEIDLYKDFFKNKVVYCNCDNAHFSNFFKYFVDEFKTLKLKRLIATSYGGAGGKKVYAVYDGKEVLYKPLAGDGDFRSDAGVALLKSADIVVTNPPFSLFREFIKLLYAHEKKFIALGNLLAATYSELFPRMIDDTLKIGLSNKASNNMRFEIPAEYAGAHTEVIDGKHYAASGALVVWFTNLDIVKKYAPMLPIYDPAIHKKYDDYDAINVNRMVDMPTDYYCEMGVPVTVFYKADPKEIEMIKILRDARIDGKKLFKRIIVKRRVNGS